MTNQNNNNQQAATIVASDVEPVSIPLPQEVETKASQNHKELNSKAAVASASCCCGYSQGSVSNTATGHAYECPVHTAWQNRNNPSDRDSDSHG